MGAKTAFLAAGAIALCTSASFSGNGSVIRVERDFKSAPAAAFVEDEFIVELTRPARRNIVVTTGAIGPRVSIDELQAVIDGQNVTRFNRMFPAAKPQPVNGRFVDMTGFYKVRIGPGADLDNAVAAFARNPHVASAEKIGIHALYDNCATGAKLSPNDSYYDNPPPTFNWPQWDLWDAKGIDADMAWSDEAGDPSVVVVDMDSGVRYFHADLGGTNPPGPSDNSTNGNIWVNAGEVPGNGADDDGNGYVDDVIGWDFVTGNPSLCDSGGGEDCDVEDNDPRDYNGHGTHTSGTMAAITNNALSIAGVAGGFGDGTSGSAGNGSKIMCLRIGWSDILGRGFVRMDYAANAMQYVADMKNAGVNIAAVNCSWGTSSLSSLASAVNNVLAADVMIVHAAGNGNTSTADYFGGRSDIMNVAATDQNGVRASFSNYGSWVDIAAPGVDIISTYHVSSDPGPDYVAVSDGTSMAAPHVVGVAALLESCNPGLSGPDKFSIMVNNGCAAGSSQIGDILNARLALDAAGCGVAGCTSDGDCDDGDACNGLETCDLGSGVCQPGTPVNCDDSNACTADSCDPGTGACSNDAINCDDSDPCTADSCSGGVCAHDPIADCCGNGECESIEDCDSCPSDCISGSTSGAICGNGICEAGNGEDCVSCAEDCNGLQTGKPTNRFCCGDGDGQNPLPCSDSTCSTSGWSCTDTPVAGGSYCCGDGTCEGDEDSTNCSVDCGPPPVCGDEICDAVENACSCPSDCCAGAPATESGACADSCDNDCDGLIDQADPDCTCGGNKATCSVDADCCSLNCKGGQCKGN